MIKSLAGIDRGHAVEHAGRHRRVRGRCRRDPADDIGVFLDAALARAALEAACDEPLDVQGAEVDEGPLGTPQREDDIAPPRAEIDETRLGEPATAAPATAEATDDSSSSSTCRPLNLRTRPLLEWGTFATEPPMPTHPAVGNTRRSIRIAARAVRVGLQAEDRTDAAATAAGMEEGCRAWRDDLQPGASIESLPPTVSSDVGTGEQTERRTLRALTACSS